MCISLFYNHIFTCCCEYRGVSIANSMEMFKRLCKMSSLLWHILLSNFPLCCFSTISACQGHRNLCLGLKLFLLYQFVEFCVQNILTTQASFCSKPTTTSQGRAISYRLLAAFLTVYGKGIQSLPFHA